MTIEALSALGSIATGATEATTSTKSIGALGATSAAQGTDFASVLADVASQGLQTMKAGEAAAISGMQGKANVQQVVEAFLAPVLMMEVLPAVPLIGRVFSNPNHFVERVYKKHLVDVVKRFSDAIGAALPHLPPEERFWRLQFMAGSMSHILALSGVFPLMCGQPFDRAAVMARLVAFLAAGLRAPIPALEEH